MNISRQRVLTCILASMFLTSVISFSAKAATVASEGICDRTPQVQKAILAAIIPKGPPKTCDSVSDADLEKIKELNAFPRTARIELKEGDFKGLKNLETLDIRYRELKSLPPGIFSELKNLQVIDLSGNQIEELPEGIFSENKKLEKIFLDGNQIEELPEGIFSGLEENLQVIDLLGNQIEELPKNIFSGLKNLQAIDLSGNQIEELPEGIFSDQENLTLLGLASNELSDLPKSIFSKNKKLEQLSIQNNSLTSLPEGIFSSQENLKRISLDHKLYSEKDKHSRFLFVELKDPTSIKDFIDNEKYVKSVPPLIINESLEREVLSTPHSAPGM